MRIRAAIGITRWWGRCVRGGGFLSENLTRPFFGLWVHHIWVGWDKEGSLVLGLCCCVLIWPLAILSPVFIIPVARNWSLPLAWSLQMVWSGLGLESTWLWLSFSLLFPCFFSRVFGLGEGWCKVCLFLHWVRRVSVGKMVVGILFRLWDACFFFLEVVVLCLGFRFSYEVVWDCLPYLDKWYFGILVWLGRRW